MPFLLFQLLLSLKTTPLTTLRTKPEIKKLSFKFLNEFAAFLLHQQFDSYVRYQLSLAKQMDIPLLKFFFAMPEEELVKVSKHSSAEILTAMINNQANEYIAISTQRWKDDLLPRVTRRQIVAEDITLVSLLRKKAMSHFIPLFTNDINTALNIAGELDDFTQESELSSFTTFVNILNEEINKHVHFIEKINNTSPSIIYVFDLVQQKEVYCNSKTEDILGYSLQDLIDLGPNFVSHMEHPDDYPSVLKNLQRIATLEDGEIVSVEHRMRCKDGSYKWMRNYESVFKRNADGKPSEIIGIALEIEKEKQMAEELMWREQQLKEAQELTLTGNYDWNLQTLEGNAADQVYRILEIEKGVKVDGFLKKVHPEDVEKLKHAIENSINNKVDLDEQFRYQCAARIKTVWTKGEVYLKGDKPFMKGIMIDLTERQQLVQQLQESESLYKQAQALTHIGNWSWDLSTDKVSWSDEMFRIYDLEPTGELMTVQESMKYLYQEDNILTVEQIKEDFKKASQHSSIYKIISKNGKEKILQSKSETIVAEGNIIKVVGTCQDVTEKQLLIQKLEKSEQLYKEAEAISHIGNWTMAVKDMALTWSDELYRIYAMDPQKDELNFEDVRTLTDPDDWPAVANLMAIILTEKKEAETVYRITAKDGSKKILLSRGKPVLNKDGEVINAVGTVQDVTEQKLIEKQLFENQIFIKKIADATPAIITQYNIKNGQYNFISGGITKILGYETEEVREKSAEFFMSIIHPDDLDKIMAENFAALEKANETTSLPNNDVLQEFQYRMRHKTGAYKWLHTYGTVFDRDEEGKVEHVLNISVDITDKVETVSRLQEQEMFTKSIAEASPTILYLFDLEEKRFLYVNKEVTEVLGYIPEDVIALGSKVSAMFLHPEDEIKSQGNYVKFKHSYDTSTLHQFEGRILDKNGNWKWMLTREIIFKRDERGKPIQVIGSALDITERKEMEQALVFKTLQLQQSNANLEEFAHIASHDLQEPLRKISTFGDRLLAKQYNSLSEEGREHLDKIISSAKRMQQLINDILSISMITGEKGFKEYSLQNVLEEVFQNLEHKIERSSAKIDYQPLPKAYIIPSQFRQLFQNLISNSIKFMKKDEEPVIFITHEIIPASEAAIYHLKKESNYLKISFTDNGIGFEPVYAEKIFAIFQRLHGRSEYEGTGIGLAICRKIVENHEGVIYGESELGKGATFTIIIPATR